VVTRIGLEIPPQSPQLTGELLKSHRIGVAEDVDDTDGMTAEEIDELIRDREAKERALVLEMVGDIPDADVKPPENVLFVCKLNPVTREEDLEVIFSRFGAIVSCEVIRDQKSGESLQYAFVEFERESDCEKAYFKMDNVLIDDRRIHVDFSQSVSKIKWFGKGKGGTVVKDFVDGNSGGDKREDRFVLKKSAFGQRLDAKYDYVYDERQGKPTGAETGNRSPDRVGDDRERHHRSKRTKRSRSRSTDRQRQRYGDRDRDDRGGRDRDRYRDRYSDRDRKSDHKRDIRDDYSRHRRHSSPERSSHSRGHRSRH
jgi:peptidyl-prolyl cis-trans isomerase-like 4